MEDGKGGINVHKGGLEIIMIIYAAGDLEITKILHFKIASSTDRSIKCQ